MEVVSRTEALARLTAEGTFEIVEDHAHGYPLRVYRNAPPSFRAIVELSRRFGERPFLIYGEEVLTYQEHFGKVAALAHHLRAIGVEKGERIAIGMRNYPEWVISFWACQAIGAVSVAINAWWTGPEIAFALEDSQPAALLIDGERLQRLEPLIGAMRGLKGVVPEV
jgi:long-chain acyl-CoA synthetase